MWSLADKCVEPAKNRLLTPFQGHYFDIRTQNATTMARHFNPCEQDNPDPFDGVNISVVYFVKKYPDSVDSQRERDAEEKKMDAQTFHHSTEGFEPPRLTYDTQHTPTHN